MARACMCECVCFTVFKARRFIIQRSASHHPIKTHVISDLIYTWPEGQYADPILRFWWKNIFYFIAGKAEISYNLGWNFLNKNRYCNLRQKCDKKKRLQKKKWLPTILLPNGVALIAILLACECHWILFLCIQDMFFSGSMRDVLTRRWTRASDGFIMLGKENIDFRNRTFRMKKWFCWCSVSTSRNGFHFFSNAIPHPIWDMNIPLERLDCCTI